MAYPFTRLPTFYEFCQILEGKFGCRYQTLSDANLTDKQGNRHDIKYLERVINGETIECVVVLSDKETLLPSMVRNICSRLKIDPKDLDIGFDLG